jgi:hypothetical protein
VGRLRCLGQGLFLDATVFLARATLSPLVLDWALPPARRLRNAGEPVGEGCNPRFLARRSRKQEGQEALASAGLRAPFLPSSEKCGRPLQEDEALPPARTRVTATEA